MITNANIEEIINKVKEELNKQVTLRDVMFKPIIKKIYGGSADYFKED